MCLLLKNIFFQFHSLFQLYPKFINKWKRKHTFINCVHPKLYSNNFLPLKNSQLLVKQRIKKTKATIDTKTTPAINPFSKSVLRLCFSPFARLQTRKTKNQRDLSKFYVDISKKNCKHYFLLGSSILSNTILDTH